MPLMLRPKSARQTKQPPKSKEAYPRSEYERPLLRQFTIRQALRYFQFIYPDFLNHQERQLATRSRMKSCRLRHLSKSWRQKLGFPTSLPKLSRRIMSESSMDFEIYALFRSADPKTSQQTVSGTLLRLLFNPAAKCQHKLVLRQLRSSRPPCHNNMP